MKLIRTNYSGKAKANSNSNSNSNNSSNKNSNSNSNSNSSSNITINSNNNDNNVNDAYSFKDLGLCEWLCKSAKSMGFKRPTDVQKACIPAILQKRNVMGCAMTGSGKTAAFALPILHHLSIDPYGIFAVVLTPTRELAVQIAEQFTALGAPIGLRTCLIIGGVNMTEQTIALSLLPHIVIATPGRLRHHLEGPSPPKLNKSMYLVLDEADRLISSSLSSELTIIVNSMNKNKQLLLFSATLTESLLSLESLLSSNTLKYDLTDSNGDVNMKQKVPSKLLQQYLFIPSQVKLCYLVGIIKNDLILSFFIIII